MRKEKLILLLEEKIEKKRYAVFGFSLKKQDERNEGKKNEEKRRE